MTLDVNKQQKKILISGYYGHGNIGDEAMLFAIAEQLRGHQLIVVSLDPDYTRNVQGLNAVDFFDTKAIEQEVQRSDFIIVGGGGLFQEFPDIDYYDSRVSRLFHRHEGKVMDFAIVPIIAAVYKKPLFFLSMGLGPLFSEEAKAFYRYILSLSSWITVRDRYSLSWVKKLGRHEGVALSADPAFLLKEEDREEEMTRLLEKYRLTGKKFFTLSLRDWIYPALLQEKIGYVARALNDFLSTSTLNAAFIPFQQVSKEAHPTQDRKIGRQLIKMLDERIRDRVVLVEEDLMPQEILAFMKKGMFGIGMRYHFLIFSFLNNIPAIALSYDEKCTTLMKEMGLEDLSLEFFSLDHEALFNRIQKVAGQVHAYEEIIRMNLPAMKVRAAESFATLQGFLHGGDEEIRSDSSIQTLNGGIDNFHELKKLTFYKDGKIKDLTEDLRNKLMDIEALRAELSEKARAIGEREQTIEKKEHVIETDRRIIGEKEHIIEEKERTINELNSRLSQAYCRLNQICNSKTWKLGQAYGKLFGMESRWRQSLLKLRGQRHHAILSPPVNEEAIEEGRQLSEFLAFHRNKKELYLLFSPAVYHNIGGQRGVRFAQELSKLNKPVVYIRSLQNHVKDEVSRIDDNIIEFPLNWFIPLAHEIISSPLLRDKKKIMIFQVTFQKAFEMISFANAHGWITVYDIVDDWEEFYHENFIAEYDSEIERYVINNSDVVLAVNQPLIDKFQEFGDIMLLPNGYSPDLLKDAPVKKLRKGSITAGFFGHLHQARFDWPLLTNAAKRNPEWMFHIIGFGEPAGLSLPENILMIGPIEPSALSGYAKNWDVGIIPYQKNELCRRLNPIKIFEYLCLGLPIVATGCEDVKNYPYSFYAEGEEEFVRYVKEASVQSVDGNKIAGLLQESTWENRVTRLLDVIDKHDGFKKFCIGT
jgi:polysaccharide pyruvyl transferase CsaB